MEKQGKLSRLVEFMKDDPGCVIGWATAVILGTIAGLFAVLALTLLVRAVGCSGLGMGCEFFS